MATLSELVAKQNQTMGSISRTVSNFKKMGQAKVTRAVVQGRIVSLKEKFALCQDLDAKIVSCCDGKTAETLPYIQDKHFLECEADFEEALDHLSEVLSTLLPPEGDEHHHVSRSSEFSSRPQLPPINLPTFDGSFERWESFRDRFTSLITNNRNLSDADRMHYLCSNVSGDASNAISHLAITDANFSIAWKILVSRYENKRRLINGHLQTLFSLPQLASETYKDLQTLRDKVNMSIHALRNLNRPVDKWDDILVFFVAQKLDKSSRKAWELQLGDTLEYPTYEQLDKFIESRIRAFEAISSPKIDKPFVNSTKATPSKSIASHSTTATNISCALCKLPHSFYKCSTFLSYTPSQRFEYVKRENRCINCLGSKHTVKQCKSVHTCKTCHQRHHTLLHFVDASKSNTNESTSVVDSKVAGNATVAHEIAAHSISYSTPRSTILLATARVRVYSPHGRFVYARALLDQGSVATLISSNLAQCLRLAKIKRTTRVTGIGESQSVSHYAAHIQVTPSSQDAPAYSTLAYVIKSLSRYVPHRINSSCQWAHTSDLALADNDPLSSDPIELIIGADLFGQLVCEGVRKGTAHEPIAQKTTLGWILTGPISESHPSSLDSVTVHHGTILEDLDLHLQRFWEIEELPQQSMWSAEEQKCEEHFLATHHRTSDGRYVVRLPFRNDLPIKIGESRCAALSSLYRAERRFQHEPIHATLYRDFLDEYENLGHMAKVLDRESNSSQINYIPHHAVLRESSLTSRLRVVFNASSRTSNNTSLNDHLLVGPKLQTDLIAVLLRWRQYQYVYTADIAKMYRQILIDPRDVDFQRILWRTSPSDSVAEYRLLTVTYGTASAPYQALRVLEQLAVDEGSVFPLAVPVMKRQRYIDDCAFGADDPESAREVRNQLIALLKKGGFPLRKWASNCPDLLSDLDPSDHGLACTKELQIDESLKILGISWNPKTDHFQFYVKLSPNPGETKRAVLSSIAKLFDPLGWVTPVTVVAKILMQRLWLLKCDWDDLLPPELRKQWWEYYTQLSSLESILIPRWTKHGSNTLRCELHGFSDASTTAYAAVVYLRLVRRDGSVHVSFLAAKSKVAPIKTLSVPRLELSGALLLARLLSCLQSTLQFEISRCYCWTDSTITLSWLKQSPSQWKVFVANRVAEVQTLLPTAIWRHVPSGENPADGASRGISPSNLANCNLWWSGPTWLTESPTHWPSSSPAETDTFEERRLDVHINLCRRQDPWDLAVRYSSWTKLLRVTAYIYRFIQNIRSRLASDSNEVRSCLIIAVSPTEVQLAKIFWLKTLQSETFAQEISDLSRRRPVAKASSLASLNPYLDDDGLIRVGGRLEKADLPVSTKHPIVVKSHPLLSLIVSHAHEKTLHGGSQITLSYLRTELWVFRARTVIRAILRRCVTCARHKAKLAEELMGNLPAVRVNQSLRAFEHTGVDYAGPILVRTAPGRGHKAYKAYIAVFVCMTTKALHLDLVSDYSSAAFLACFSRFVSRRGTPHKMYSDNGTTFQGGDRELSVSFNAALRDSKFLSQLAIEKISWHFLPPAAPHFGGLWEAGVRCVKYHLKRSIGSHTLTYEEMSTLLCRIEACLNSRPIAALSENLDDYSALTPGHFLIGANIIALPEPSVLSLSENRVSRWQLVQRLSEGFWKFWATDYLHTLQQRPKWRVAQNLAKVGQIVLLRNPLAPPSHWELGRIIECHPGDDGITRVVTVRTAQSVYKRPITKICFLPIDINVASDHDLGKAGGSQS